MNKSKRFGSAERISLRWTHNDHRDCHWQKSISGNSLQLNGWSTTLSLVLLVYLSQSFAAALEQSRTQQLPQEFSDSIHLDWIMTQLLFWIAPTKCYRQQNTELRAHLRHLSVCPWWVSNPRCGPSFLHFRLSNTIRNAESPQIFSQQQRNNTLSQQFRNSTPAPLRRVTWAFSRSQLQS